MLAASGQQYNIGGKFTVLLSLTTLTAMQGHQKKRAKGHQEQSGYAVTQQLYIGSEVEGSSIGELEWVVKYTIKRTRTGNTREDT